MVSVDAFLIHYGYFAIFGLLMFGIVGPLIPDETILVASGVFIHRGQLHFLPAILAGYAGSVCGITLSYAIGFYGFTWAEQRWPHFNTFVEDHLAKAERWFRRFGKWTLFLGYYVAGVRHVTAIFAGMSRMPFREFAVFAYSGALGWVMCFMSVGYFAGEGWSKFGRTVDFTILGVAAAICLTIAIWWKLRARPS